MIEKIKGWLGAARDLLLYIATPIAFVAGFIYYMLAKQRGLEDKIADLTRDEKQKEFEDKVKEDENAVQETSSDYARVRDEYLKQHGAGGQPVPNNNSGSGRGDSKQGQDDQGS